MKKPLILLAALLMTLSLTARAEAVIWQDLYQINMSSIDQVQVWHVAGDLLATPTLTNFSSANANPWTGYDVSNTYAYGLGGPSQNFIRFYTNFEGEEEGAKYLVQVSSNGSVWRRQEVWSNYEGYIGRTLSINDDQQWYNLGGGDPEIPGTEEPIIPEPTTMLLMSSGLLGFFLRRKYFS